MRNKELALWQHGPNKRDKIKFGARHGASASPSLLWFSLLLHRYFFTISHPVLGPLWCSRCTMIRNNPRVPTQAYSFNQTPRPFLPLQLLSVAVIWKSFSHDLALCTWGSEFKLLIASFIIMLLKKIPLNKGGLPLKESGWIPHHPPLAELAEECWAKD